MTILKPKLKPTGSQQQSGPQQAFADEFNGTVECPWCESMNSKISSPFGSTVSEIIFTCGDCNETFGWMKWDQRRGNNKATEST